MRTATFDDYILLMAEGLPGLYDDYCRHARLVEEIDLKVAQGVIHFLAVKKRWEDEADTGFWNWERHGEFVIMSAELELAVWDIHGQKKWTTFVEPSWNYERQEPQRSSAGLVTKLHRNSAYLCRRAALVSSLVTSGHPDKVPVLVQSCRTSSVRSAMLRAPTRSAWRV